MKKSLRFALAALVVVSFAPVASFAAMPGGNPDPQAMPGGNPHPLAMPGGNPHPYSW
jgi:hypothetical protein